MTLAQSFDGFQGLSPEENSPEQQAQLNLFDAEDQFDDELKPKSKSNGRKGPGAADKRATHNAIERARRESLNGRFMTLAEALPSMAKVKRPSKSVIVQNALSFVYDAQVKEHALVRENNQLRREVDQLRRQLGMPPLPPPAPLSGANPAAANKLERAHSFSASSVSDDLTLGMGALDTHGVSPQQASPASHSFPSPPSSGAGHDLMGTSPSFASGPGAFSTLFSPAVTSASLGDSPPAAVVGSPFSNSTSAGEAMEERRQQALGGGVSPSETSSPQFVLAQIRPPPAPSTVSSLSAPGSAAGAPLTGLLHRERDRTPTGRLPARYLVRLRSHRLFGARTISSPFLGAVRPQHHEAPRRYAGLMFPSSDRMTELTVK